MANNTKKTTQGFGSHDVRRETIAAHETRSAENAGDKDRAVTVLIVTHQSENVLNRCLGALATAAPNSRLTIKAWDNASTDNSVAKLQNADITVTVSSRNIGFAAAVNRLAEDVETPFLFLLNPDAAPRPGAIDALIDAALAMPDRDMFCGRTVFADGRENTTSAWGAITPKSTFLLATGVSFLRPQSPYFAPETMPDWDRLTDREVDVATGCALLIRTSVWRDLGGFDERYWLYCEEAEMQHRMVNSGRKRPWFVSAAISLHDDADELRPEVSAERRIMRSVAMQKGRATFMRNAWTGAARWTAGPILTLIALRYGIQSLAGGADSVRYSRLWKSRHDWTAGYPSPDTTSGSLSTLARASRLVLGAIDPRSYLHAIRIVNFYNYAHARPRREMILGKAVKITPNATFYNGTRISIGNRTLIAARVTLMAGGVHGRIEIGQDCLIGPNVLITAANYRRDPDGRHSAGRMREADVILEDNVWLGAGVVVLPGVRIGQGAIVGAGAVVTKDIAPGGVAVGASAHSLPGQPRAGDVRTEE